MERSKSMGLNSILTKQIESYARNLADLCERFIEYAKENLSNLGKFLTTYCYGDEEYYRFISSCSKYNLKTPHESFQTFVSSLPLIDKPDVTIPEKTNDNIWIYFRPIFEKADNNPPFEKALINCFLLVVINDFLNIMLKNLNSIDEKYVKNIFGFIESRVLLFECFKEPIIHSFLITRYSKSLHKISSINTDSVWKILVDSMLKKGEQIYYLKIMESIIVPNNDDSSYYSTLKIVFDIVKDENEKNSKELIIAAAWLLTSIMCQKLSYNPNENNIIIHKDIIIYFQKKVDNTANYFLLPFFALISNYIDIEPNLKSVNSFLKIYQKNNLTPESFEFLIDSISKKLWTKIYLPKSWSEENSFNINFYRQDTDLSELINNIFSWKSSDLEKLSNDSSVIVGLFLQLAITDFSQFVSLFMATFLNKLEFSSELPISPFLECVYYLFNNIDDNIGKYDPNNQQIIGLFKSLVKKVILRLLKQMNTEFDRCRANISVKSIFSLLDSEIDNNKSNSNLFRTIFKTTFPVYPSNFGVRSFNLLSKWEYFLPKDMSKVFAPINPEEFGSSKNKDVLSNITEKWILFISVYLEPNDEIIDKLCYILFSSSHINAALAIRTIQILIHIDQSIVALIIRSLCQILNNFKLNMESLLILINTMNSVLESIHYEKISLDNDIMNEVPVFIVLGLCVPYVSIRVKIFEIIRIKAFMPYLYQFQLFLEKYDKNICFRAVSNIIHSFTYCEDEEIRTLPVSSFFDIAQTNRSVLYLYYLSSFSYYLGNCDNEFLKQSLIPIYKMLFKILRYSFDSFGTIFTKNCLTFLIPLFVIMDDKPDQYRAFKSLQIMNLISENENFIMKLPIIEILGIFSSVSFKLVDHLVPFFSNTNDIYIYCLLKVTKDALSRGYLNMIKSIPLRYIFEISYYYQYQKQTFTNNNLVSSQMESIQESNRVFVCDLFYCLDMVYQEQIKTKESSYKKPYLSKGLFLSTATGHDFDNIKWFMFYYSYIEKFESENIILLRNAGLSSFSSWMRISKIPQEYCIEVFKVLISSPLNTKNICSVIFSQYPSQLMIYILNDLNTSFMAFQCLQSQIDCPNELYNNFQRISEYRDNLYIENPIFSLYYNHIGSILALSFYFLISSDYNERTAAIGFLESILLITSIIRNDKSICMVLLKAIHEVRKTAQSSFLVFVQSGVFSLVSLFEQHFSFCSEQFIGMCFKLLKKIAQPNVHDSKSFSMTNNNEDKHEDNEKSNFEFLSVNRSELVSSFISIFLKQLTYDLKNDGICMNCEILFREYKVYDFFVEVLSACTNIGLIQPFTIILNMLIGFDLRFFMFSLINIIYKHKEHSDSAKKIMVYISKKKSDEFIQEIRSYLSVSAWYFYEVQIVEPDTQSPSTIDIDYNNTIEFILETIEVCQIEDTSIINSILPIIIAFIAIRNGNIPDQVNEKLQLIGKLSNNIYFGTGLVDNTKLIDFLLLFIVPSAELEVFLLEWGFSCGDLDTAKMALTLYNRLKFVFHADNIPTLIRCILVSLKNINELKNHKYSDSKTQNSVSKGSKLPKIEEFIGLCIEIMMSIDISNYTPDLFWISCLLLKWKSTILSKSSLFVLTIIKNCVYSKALLSSINAQLFGKNIKKTIIAPNLELFNELMKLPLINTESIELVFEIIIGITINGYIELLSKDFNMIASSFFVVIPYIWGNKNSDDYKVIESHYKGVFGRVYGKNVDLFPDRKRLVPYFLGEGFDPTILLGFYGKVIRLCEEKVSSFVFEICTELLQNNREQSVPKVYSELICSTLSNIKLSASKNGIRFIETVLSKSERIESNEQDHKPNNDWILSDLIDYDTLISEIRSISSFSSIKTLPIPTNPDLYLLGLPFQKAVLGPLSRSVYSPFLDRYNQFFGAQMQSSSQITHTYQHYKYDPDEALKLILELNDDIRNSKSNQIMANETEFKDPGMISIDLEEFYPKDEEILNMKID